MNEQAKILFQTRDIYNLEYERGWGSKKTFFLRGALFLLTYATEFSMFYFTVMSKKFTGFSQTFGDLADFVKFKGVLVLFTGIECAILGDCIVNYGY